MKKPLGEEAKADVIALHGEGQSVQEITKHLDENYDCAECAGRPELLEPVVNEIVLNQA